MSEKKGNMRWILLTFFVIEFVLAFFIGQQLHIGADGIHLEKPEQEKMQDTIASEIQPDRYAEDNIIRMRAVANEQIEAIEKKSHAEMADLQAELEDQVQALDQQLQAKAITQEQYTEQQHALMKASQDKAIAVHMTCETTKDKILATLEAEIEQYQYSFTYGSKTLYNFFTGTFKEGSVWKIFGSDSGIANFHLWRMLLYLDIFIILLALYINRKLSFIPSLVQVVFEFVYGFLEDLIFVTLGEKKAKNFVPFFVTLFIFIFFSNWAALLPIPGISEPTRNLNVPLGMGLMALTVVHFNSMRKKGIIDYVKGYCEPIVFMMPLNVIGEVSKIISISFRLFGNIFGGAIITIVVSALTYYVIVPVGLNMFFTMFAGTIQAFVFTMLSLTYLALEITD